MTPEVSVLTLRDLEYIVAIAEHLNFRLAAKFCAVSQPALSGQIKKVELALGTQIFERTNREVIVTAVGKQMVEQCRVILEELEVLGSIARGGEEPLSGHFQLGVSRTMSQYLMPKLSAYVYRAYRDIELIIREGVRAELLEALRIGMLDAVLTSYPLPKSSGRFHVQPLFAEPLLLAVGKKSPLFRQKHISVDQLSLDNLVVLDEQHALTKSTFDMVRVDSSEVITQTLFTTSIESLLVMVANSEKSAIVPLLASKVRRPLKALEFRPLSPATHVRKIALVWRPRYRGNKALAALSDTIKTFAHRIHPELDIL